MWKLAQQQTSALQSEAVFSELDGVFTLTKRETAGFNAFCPLETTFFCYNRLALAWRTDAVHGIPLGKL